MYFCCEVVVRKVMKSVNVWLTHLNLTYNNANVRYLMMMYFQIFCTLSVQLLIPCPINFLSHAKVVHSFCTGREINHIPLHHNIFYLSSDKYTEWEISHAFVESCLLYILCTQNATSLFLSSYKSEQLTRTFKVLILLIHCF